MLASRQVTKEVDKEVQTTAAVSSVVISQQTTYLVALVHSYASRPSLVNGVFRSTPADSQVESTLTSLAQAVPGISASFVTDLQGTSRYTYPLQPGVIGTNFAFRDWFKGLVASGHPFVSNAIETKQASHTLAVTVTDYIKAADGQPIGVLGVNYSLAAIAAFSADVSHAQGVTVKVTDRVGTSLTTSGQEGLVSLATDPRVRAAQAGHSGLSEYAPLRSGGRQGPTELSAYAPIHGTPAGR